MGGLAGEGDTGGIELVGGVNMKSKGEMSLSHAQMTQGRTAGRRQQEKGKESLNTKVVLGGGNSFVRRRGVQLHGKEK